MERTWLEALAAHAVFSSPSSSLSSAAHHGEQLPPSPGLSTVASFHGDESTTFAGSHAHSRENGSHRHQATCVVRKTELLVAAGSAIRLADLAHFKTRVEAASGHDGVEEDVLNGHGGDTTAADYAGPSTLGSFKTLATPAIDFEILSLVPSPSSRYVAAVGASQVVVVQLPRRGWSSLVGRSIECSQDPVGPFYHTRSSTAIAQVSFHPWGVDDTTLLVLTSDGLLREYDILEDPEEPTQILDFSQADDGRSVPPVEPLPHRGVRYGLNSRPIRRREKSASATPSRRRSRSRSRSRSMSRATPSHSLNHGKAGKNGFGLTEDTSSKAVSFCFGKGHSDWAPFTLYCLMASGDLFCVCPYLPKTAHVPALLLDSLLALTSAKINHLTTPGPATQLSLYEKREMEAEYSAQIKFLQALLEQRQPTGAAEDDSSIDSDDELILVKYPAYLRRVPARQGPFLLQPAPRELDSDDDEPAASDLVYMLMESETTEEDDEDASTALGLVLMSYENGKMDICVDIAKVDATWSKQDSEASLPSLLVYESVDLLGPSRTALSDGPVLLLADPEYSDTVYAQHNLGVHSISLRPIIDIFTSSAAASSLSTVLGTAKGSEVTWLLQEGLERNEESFFRDAVIGVSTINDVYLGYAVIVLHANMHVTGIELALRSERDVDVDLAGASLSTPTINGNAVQNTVGSHFTAFAGARDFVLPELLTKNGSSRRLSTRYASPPPSSSHGSRASRDAQPKMDLTIEALRFVGGTIEGLDKNIRDLISAANAVQDRLGDQLEEIPRQVDKLVGIEDELEQKKAEMSSAFVTRLDDVKRNQQLIASRADKILQRLIDASQPDLSVYEKRWIEELERVQHTVGSAADRKSLESRAERLKEQLDVLRPRLEEMVRAKEMHGNAISRERLGESQRVRVEGALAEESRLVGEARNRIEKLQKKIVLSSRSVSHAALPL